MFSTEAQRFKYIRSTSKLSQAKFAESLNISQSRVRDIELEKQGITKELAINIEKNYNFDLRWILTGEGEVYFGKDETCEKIPILGEVERIVSTSYNIEQERPKDYLNIPKTQFNQILANIKTSYIFIVRGYSMAPTILDGDKVLVDISKHQILNDKIYVIRIEDTLMIKRLQKLPKGALKIISDNKNHDSYILNPEKDNYKVLGQALWLGRCIS